MNFSHLCTESKEKLSKILTKSKVKILQNFVAFSEYMNFSSKMAFKILIFSVVLGAEYSFYVKSIATYAPQKFDIINHS